MKNRLYLVILLFGLLTISVSTKAQILQYDLQTVNVQIKPVVHLGDVDTLFFSAANVSNTDTFFNPFPGISIAFYLFFDTLLSPPTAFSYSLPHHITDSISLPNFLAPGHEVSNLFIKVPISTNYMRAGGNNEVVIWPMLLPNEQNPNNNSGRAFFYCDYPLIANSLDLLKPDVQIYPNPVNNKMYFQLQDCSLDEPLKVEIYNSIGQTVYADKLSVPNSALVTIDVEALNIASGLYFVHIESGKFKKTQKINKQ